MSSDNNATVRHTALAHRAVAEGLVKLDAICAAGALSPEVQASPLARLALEALKAEVAVLHEAVTALANAIIENRAATAAVHAAFGMLDGRVRLYERTVRNLAHGNAAIIARAGLLSREIRRPGTALGTLTAASGKPGPRDAEVVLSWPEVKGATGYAVEVSYGAESLDGPWTALNNCSRRRRVIEAPAPGAQLVARVAAVDARGTRSAWSPPILVTARGRPVDGKT